jgi:6-phospho-3-hexuloisomerase
MENIREVMVNELKNCFCAVDENEINEFSDSILKANKIFTYACGREGLMLKAFAMRLHHLGFKVHVVGDMTAPAIEEGDVMMVVCGPGYVSTTKALLNIAKNAGASIIGMTANPQGEVTKYFDKYILIPAQTMLVSENEVKSIQPMGSIFEQAQLLVEEYIILKLTERLNLSESEMRKNHTNLE